MDTVCCGFNMRWARCVQSAMGAGFHGLEAGLNGHRAVFDDPVMGGSGDLLNVLKSNMRVDLLIIMPGSNSFNAD